MSLEKCFVDGTKIESAANKYTFVWRKNIDRNEKNLDKKIRIFLDDVATITHKENEIYGKKDFAELGDDVPITYNRRNKRSCCENKQQTCRNKWTIPLSMEKLLNELQYPDHIEKVVKEKLEKPDIAEIASNAYSGEGFDYPLCKRMPLTRLAVATWLLQKTYGEYKSIGVADDIIFETFRDVTLRATMYYQKTEKVGISKEDVIWFRHLMNVNMFKVGVLQFQPFEMIYLDEETIGEHYMTFSKEQKPSLPNGAPVINCHIQRNADLSLDRVTASLQDAKDFFMRVFPKKQFQAFLCYSWLLYPQMAKRLSQESRIRKFYQLFMIIGECNDSEQAIENLFADGKRKRQPQMSSLQKMAMDHLDWFGFACGIIKWNNK